MSDNPMVLSRRKFLVSAGAGGLVLAMRWASAEAAMNAAETGQVFEPNAFIKIDDQGKVTVIIKHIEFGQGTYTGLATLVAEELDADWDQVVCEHAPANAEKYANLQWGNSQGTGGSSAIANAFMQMREAGATARVMLVAAAAEKWGVPAAEIRVQSGRVTHTKSNRRADFGELAALAARQEVPTDVELKSPQQFQLIGKNLPRKDEGKVDGRAVFTQDIQLPDQLTAVVAHAPAYGAKLKSYNDSDARQSDGVVAVLRLDNAVAVLANTFWQAKMGRDKLKIQWDESAAYAKSTDELRAEYAELATQAGAVAAEQGEVEKAFASAHKVMEADYEFPYLAHATMEPMNCVVQLQWSGGDSPSVVGAEYWYGCQLQSLDLTHVTQFLGVDPSQVTINTLFAGGSFGRRGNARADYVIEATAIAKAYGKGVPIKLVWTREDDTQAGYFRPMYHHKIKAGVDEQGKIVAWQHRIVGQSILSGTFLEGMVQNGIDSSSVEGATHLPYAIPNFRVELHTTQEAVPVLWWRSVGSTHTAFATEAFIDEIAHALSRDPLDYRLSLLGEDVRYRQVLEAVAEKAQWRSADTSKGKRHRGLAVHKSFGTYVAQVVDISQSNEGVKIDRVTCAVDCGVAVNPDVIAAQMEGGIGYGLSPALVSKITFHEGKVVESNFHDYQVLRMPQMPEVEVHIVPSAEPPTGVGEPATPVIAPALANALAAAGMPRERNMPFNAKFA